MISGLRCGILMAISLIGMTVIAAAQKEDSGDDEKLPKIADMKLPEADQLLRGKPVDWVVLKNDDVIVVEPVAPRPDTLLKLDEEVKKLGNVKARTREELEALKQKRLDLLKLQVTLLDDDSEDPDYTIEVRQIKEIVYHEDMVLNRAGRCIDEGLTALAFEFLVYLDLRHPNWPGYSRQANRLLLKESQMKLERGDPEAALRFAEELYAQDKTFTGLSAVAGKAVDALVQQAVDQSIYRKARHFLGRLAAKDKEHPVYEKWRGELASRTSTRLDAARTVAAQGDFARAALLVDEAAHIWPDTNGLKELHKELTNRYQLLRVGTLDLPTDAAAYPFPTQAQERWTALTTLHWFETSRFDESGPRYRSVPCESWEPDDLGRQIRFVLRRERAEWETRPRFTSATLAAELKSRLQPESVHYDERLASNVAGLSTPTPFELTIRFRRPPLRPEGLFRFPLTASAEAPELNADLKNLSSDTGQRFQKLAGENGQVRAVRLRPEADSVKQRHLTEIVEQRYDDWDHLLQGLQRGEVSAVARVGHIDLASLKDDPRFFVLPYAQPVSHLIQFHPASVPLRNGQLRRALLHGVPRDQLLTEELLPGVPKEPVVARLSASPLTMGTAMFNRLLPQPEHDLVLSAGLVSTARKGLGGKIPPLKITFPPGAEIRRVVDAMIVQWKRVGLDVVPVTSAEDDWDLAYRTVQFREPTTELWPFLTLDSSAGIESLQRFPERLRRQIMEMERATDWSSAVQILHRLQSDLLIDAWWIPLWEVDEFFLVRRNVSGLPEKLASPYQDAERWIVQSWYPTEQP